MEIGFVVVEFNQAGGTPRVREDVHYDRDDAEDVAQQCRDEVAQIGRRERFAVGTVTIEEDE